MKYEILWQKYEYERINAYESEYVHRVMVKYFSPVLNKQVEQGLEKRGEQFTDVEIRERLLECIDGQKRKIEEAKELLEYETLYKKFKYNPNKLLKIELIKLIKLMDKHRR